MDFENLVLKTKRCTIREYRESDVSACFEILKKYPEITKFTLFEAPKKIEETMANFFDKESEVFRRAIIHNDKFIGRCGLHKIDMKKKSAEFGFWVSPEFQEQGIGTEILQEMCRFVFEDMKLEKMESGSFMENKASIRVHEKVGFKKCWRADKHFEKNGKKHDLVGFELLKANFYS